MIINDPDICLYYLQGILLGIFKKFKMDYEQQIFKKFFMAILFY